MPPSGNACLHYPATLRNRRPIRDVLRQILPAAGLVLEIASGSGEHAVYFASAFPKLDWQPTERDAALLDSIAAHRAASSADNIRPPLWLDVTEPEWPVPAADAILAINMVHIAPWSACVALLAGSGRLLVEGEPLLLYGPFARGGRHTAPSNEAFDQSLRQQNPDWGVRDLDCVDAAAAAHGLSLYRVIEMPANNLIVVLHKGA